MSELELDPTKYDEVIEALKDIGTATVAGSLGHAGFKNPHMVGPVTQNPGKSIVGIAQTLQFLPQRPDLFSEGEYSDPETQLHRHVLYHVQEGDVVLTMGAGDITRSGPELLATLAAPHFP